MSNYISRIKKKTIPRLEKPVKESAKDYLLTEKYDMENELLHFLDVENFNETNACHEMHSEQPKYIAMSLELCELYHQAVCELIGYGCINYIRQYLYHLRSVANRWCQFKKDSYISSQLKCNTLYYRIAYIYRNSTCLSSAVAHYFGIVLSQHTNIVKKLLQNKEIRICSVGGGSTSDVVGLIKVLESIFNVTGNVHVSIIDADKKWQNVCIKVLKGLRGFRNSICKIDFIEADLTEGFNDEVKHAIENAHIVSLVKFVSELENRKRSHLFHKVNSLINSGTILFFLDNPDFKIVEACGGYLGNLPECKLLYEAPFDSHTLHVSVVEKQLLLYDYIFGTNICNTMCKVFCRVWVKCDKILAEENARVKEAGHREQRFLERKLNQHEELELVYNQFKNHDVVTCLPWKFFFSRAMKTRGFSERRIQETLEEVQMDHLKLRRLGQFLLKNSYKDLMKEESKIKDIERNINKQWVTNFHESRKKTASVLAAYRQSISELLQLYKQIFP
ncbi:uncharacterized protein CDAR_266801 [Caerostris darwini]|uniref:Uncharacterized protein n=1 Tax=Caerostris darwini TaxID=1538125 RepID=A0AAV4QNG6_9ARAC|nr:uncharacterized protein CDAR_266801 [Caerostris darwini]